MIIVHDDLDLPFGRVQLCVVADTAGTTASVTSPSTPARTPFAFVSVLAGPLSWDTADYVLGKWSSAEQAEIPHTVDRASDAGGRPSGWPGDRNEPIQRSPKGGHPRLLNIR